MALINVYAVLQCFKTVFSIIARLVVKFSQSALNLNGTVGCEHILTFLTPEDWLLEEA